MIEQLKTIWGSFYDTSAENHFKSIDWYQSQFIKLFETMDLTIIETYNKTGTINYLSDNIKQYGLDKAEFSQYGIRYFHKYMAPAQQNFPLIYSQLLQKAFQTWLPDEIRTIKSIAVGLRYSTPQQSNIAFLNKVYFNDFDTNGLPLQSYCLLENIPYLLQDNTHFWIRIWTPQNPSKVLFYHSNPDLICTGDILSQKEKEIVRLIEFGNSDEEIMQKTHISANNFARHIKMISDKLNVQNRTALAILIKKIYL